METSVVTYGGRAGSPHLEVEGEEGELVGEPPSRRRSPDKARTHHRFLVLTIVVVSGPGGVVCGSSPAPSSAEAGPDPGEESDGGIIGGHPFPPLGSCFLSLSFLRTN